MSWGPPTTQDPNGGDPGTQLRTPPLVPDANYIDWRYTNSLVAPWTELNFHYGNDRVKATVQIASYNLTDPGYRRLESNLGINQAYLTLLWPELGGNENLHLTAHGRRVHEPLRRRGPLRRGQVRDLPVRPHARRGRDGEHRLRRRATTGPSRSSTAFGAKLEPIPFYGRRRRHEQRRPADALPTWEPYPGPRRRSRRSWHTPTSARSAKKMLLIGAHYIDAFANDNERATASLVDGDSCSAWPHGARRSGEPAAPHHDTASTSSCCGGVLRRRLPRLLAPRRAQNAIYLPDAIEVLHSFGGWQLHDNYFGAARRQANGDGHDRHRARPSTASASAQLLWHPQAFWGQGPDLHPDGLRHVQQRRLRRRRTRVRQRTS